MKNRTKGYSLWLMPEGEDRKVLQSFIRRLSGKLGTPNFPPHVTLLGQIEEDKKKVLNKTAHLAASIRKFTLNLNGAAYLDEYFRCLFLVAVEDPVLMAANLKARSLFGRVNDPPFMPHLSLVYGRLAEEAKEDIVAGMAGESLYSLGIEKISLYSTCGPPREWSHMGDFALG